MRLEIFVVVVGLVYLLVILEFVRRRKLSESFALLWSAVAIGGMVLILARPLVDRFASFVGAEAGTSVVFFFGILVLIILIVYLSVHITDLEERVEKLTEELALLRGIEPPLVDESPADEPPGA
jgi:hypothetical protein